MDPTLDDNNSSPGLAETLLGLVNAEGSTLIAGQQAGISSVQKLGTSQGTLPAWLQSPMAKLGLGLAVVLVLVTVAKKVID